MDSIDKSYSNAEIQHVVFFSIVPGSLISYLAWLFMLEPLSFCRIMLPSG